MAMPVRILLQSVDTGDVVELGRGEVDDAGNRTGPWLRQVPGILEQIAAQLTAAMDLVDAQRVDVVEQAPEPGTKPDPSAAVGLLLVRVDDGVEVVEQADEWVDLDEDTAARFAARPGCSANYLTVGSDGVGLGVVRYGWSGRGQLSGTFRYWRIS